MAEQNKLVATEKPAMLKRLVLGSMPRDAIATSTLAAGPWCFAGREDFFPSWEDTFIFPPEPFTNRALEDLGVREAEALATDIIPALARVLAPHSKLPVTYWETIFAPFTINVAKIVIYHWYNIKNLLRIYGHIPLFVELLPKECNFSFSSDADVVLHGALNPLCAHWILSLLLRPVMPKCWKAVDLPSVSESFQQQRNLGVTRKIKNFLRDVLLCLPFPRLKGMTIAQALRFSLALLHPSYGKDRSRNLADTFSSQTTGVLAQLPLDPLPIFLTFLPTSIKRLRHPNGPLSQRARPRIRAASIVAYENAPYRQRLALWRARGGRLFYVQHGGNYGQMKRICAMEFVEYTQHAFISWGWTDYSGNFPSPQEQEHFIPLPYPQLAKLYNTWHPRQKWLIFVGTEMPTVAYQLDSHPLPQQVIEYREDKQWFFEALGSDIREHSLYRPYFAVPGTLEDAPWLLTRFPQVHLCSGPLEPQILSCRLLVLDHHGTTLLEAMAANIPTVCYWNKEHWPVTDKFQNLLEQMKKLGMWNDCAENAAITVREIWKDPTTWWHSNPVQKLRIRFMENYARAFPKTGQELWLAALRRM